MENDADLVRRCLGGDPSAWEALLDRHGTYLRALLRQRAPEAADDLLQEVWTTLLQGALARYDPARPLKPFLAGIALNLCRKHREAARRTTPPSLDLSPGPGEPLDRKEALAAAKRALEALPERERLGFVLVDLEGATYAEAARILGIPEGTVGAILARARETLKKAR